MKRQTKVFLLALCIGSVVAASTLYRAYAQDAASSKDEDIRRLLDLSGAGDMGVQVMEQMITAFKQAQSGVPDKFWTDFMTEVDSDELTELVVPIYDKHLTHDDVRQLITFYETPVGKKLIAVQPKIMQESMLAGQRWGQEIAERVARKLREEGY